MILFTRYEWNNHSDLWSEYPGSKYEITPKLGKRTGMKGKRFNDLWSYISFSAQPEAWP
jgi:hypothetical protein